MSNSPNSTSQHSHSSNHHHGSFILLSIVSFLYVAYRRIREQYTKVMHPIEQSAPLQELVEEMNKEVPKEDALQKISTQAAMTLIQQPPAPATPMRFAGKLPNVAWKAFTEEELIDRMHPKVLPIEQQGDLASTADDSHNQSPPTHVIPQGSEEWLRLRETMITASNLNTLLGFWEKSSVRALGLSNYFASHEKLETAVQQLRQKFNPQVERQNLTSTVSEFPENVKVMMEWGSQHEQNAKVTYLHSFPNFKIQQTGLWQVKRGAVESLSSQATQSAPLSNHLDWSKLPPLGASPDGIVLDSGHSPVQLLEIKCPSPFLSDNSSSEGSYRYRKRKPHDSIPAYYVPQLMMQMLATGIHTTHFCSWTPTAGMSIFEVQFDAEYCQHMLLLLQLLSEKVICGFEPTPEDFYLTFSETMYKDFLQRTLHIANSPRIMMVPTAGEENHNLNGDRRLFLD